MHAGADPILAEGQGDAVAVGHRDLIEVPRVHFKPLHLFPYYQKLLGVRSGQFPVAERCYRETLSLPIFPDLTDPDVDWITERIRDYL